MRRFSSCVPAPKPTRSGCGNWTNPARRCSRCCWPATRPSPGCGHCDKRPTSCRGKRSGAVGADAADGSFGRGARKASMEFSQRLIELAGQFRDGGVPWQPGPGQYVLDLDGIVQRESPFQEGVYFVLNYPHFLKLAGGADAFRRGMLWLPTWDQARRVLRETGISDAEQQARLLQRGAIAEGSELA